MEIEGGRFEDREVGRLRGMERPRGREIRREREG